MTEIEQAEAETVAGIVAFMRERCLGHDHLADAIEAREWKK